MYIQYVHTYIHTDVDYQTRTLTGLIYSVPNAPLAFFLLSIASLSNNLFYMMDSTFAAPESTQDVSSLVQQIRQASTNLRTPEGAIDDNSRKTALSLAKQLVNALEKPEDVVMRYAFEVRLQVCNHLTPGLDIFF